MPERCNYAAFRERCVSVQMGPADLLSREQAAAAAAVAMATEEGREKKGIFRNRRISSEVFTEYGTRAHTRRA